MYTKEIQDALKYTSWFKGVFASDMLPQPERRMSMIVNTDSADKEGTHWIAVFVQNNIAEYFDPFGLPPLTKNFVDFLGLFEIWCHSNTTIQDINSEKCGEFCIAFVKERTKVRTVKEMIKL
ncbi:Peptidase-like protein [Leptotrombidium deliense]|uniref:Peptidase-like protein n=1 Tax=Leptotrombidium deliense TaxID=299467 RepID=A0A443S581_9ACAR|nr:Peptidase-like protein [Leptotrombidium deliense]